MKIKSLVQKVLCKIGEHEMVTQFLSKKKNIEEGTRKCAKCGVTESFISKIY